MLGGVKKKNRVVAAHNDEVIIVKRRCKITFKDIQNVHAMIATQLGCWRSSTNYLIVDTLVDAQVFCTTFVE